MVWLDDWERASEVNKDAGKNLLVEFSTQWCPYCKFIEENVFNKEEVIKRLESYTLLNIDGDKKENQQTMDIWNVAGFPTFIILDHAGKEILRFNDVNSVAEFMAFLDKAEKKEPTPQKEDTKERGPEYYKTLADSYSSNVLKEAALNKAAALIEDEIANFKQLTSGQKRVALDQHIDLLAYIYKELKLYSKIDDLYLKAASLAKEEAKLHDGIGNNLNLIGTVTYYYLNAKRPDDAIDFLKKAQVMAKDYWPVYTNLAKALLAKGSPDEAIVFALQGYELAKDVAKPRVALIWAECYAAKRDEQKAIEILESAIKDLKNSGSADHGRAAKMLKQLEERIKEYNRALHADQLQ